MLEYGSTSPLIDNKHILTSSSSSSTSSPLKVTPDGMTVNNHPSTAAPSSTSSFSISASSFTPLRPPVRRIAPQLTSTSEDKISPSQLDPAAISNGFVPLTRRWTFASDAATERVKAASCGDISDMMMSSPSSSSSTTTSSFSSTKTTCTISTRASPSPFSPSITPIPHKTDMKRELHRASLANEMCQSVAQLIMSPKKVMAKADRDHALLLAAEATRKHLAKFPPRYSLSVETRDVLIHMALMDEAVRTGHPAVYVQQDLSGGPNSTIQPGDRRWVVTMSCKDRPHLLDTFTRMLSEHVTKIIDADAMTSRDGMALDRFTIEGHEELTARMLTRGMEQMLRLADRTPHNRSPLGPDYNEAFPYLSNSSLLEEEEEKAEEDTVITTNSNRRQLEGDIDDEEEVIFTSPAWSPESSFVNEEEVDKEEQEQQQQEVNRQQQHQHQQQHDEEIGLGLEEEDPSCLSTYLPTLKTIPFPDITLGCLIAQSRSCEMYQAQLHRTITRTKTEETGGVDEEKEVIVVAAKVITHQSNIQRGLYELNREIEIVRQLQHPNICQFYGVANAFGSRSYCLLYEYLAGGSLSDLLRDKHRSYDFFRLATEIACGMAYLHEKGVLHRDLKSSNILMDGQGRAKIIDFGLSCMVQPTRPDLTAETGTYRWMAPEVIRHEPYSTAADVYSYGIVLWEMITRDQPFRGLTPIQAAFSVARRNERPTLPERLPLRLSSLVRRCWHQEPLRRPSFSEILRILPEVHGEVMMTYPSISATTTTSSSCSTDSS